MAHTMPKAVLFLYTLACMCVYTVVYVACNQRDFRYVQLNGSLESCSNTTRHSLPMLRCAILCSVSNCSGYMYGESGGSPGDGKTCTICPILKTNRVLPSDLGMFLRLGVVYTPVREVETPVYMYPGRIVTVRGIPTAIGGFRLDFYYNMSPDMAVSIVYQLDNTNHSSSGSISNYGGMGHGSGRINIEAQCINGGTACHSFEKTCIQVNTEFYFLLIFGQSSAVIYLNDEFLVDFPYQCSWYTVNNIRRFSASGEVLVKMIGMT